VYLAQIGLPAVVGAVIGAFLGNHWALPLIQMAPIPTKVTVPTWIDYTAPLEGWCFSRGSVRSSRHS
jgi:hypothetical protein